MRPGNLRIEMRFEGALASCLAVTFLLSGCAHYQLPVSELESSEVSGRKGIARLEALSIIGGSDLINEPTADPPTQEEIEAGDTTTEYKVGGSWSAGWGILVGIGERSEIGARFSTQGPFTLRYKHQWLGLNRSDAPKGNLSSSLVLAPGFLLGQSDGRSTQFYAIRVSNPFGYRLGPSHLLLLSPFFAWGSVNGVPRTAGDTDATQIPSDGTSGSATQYGAGLGYEYEVMDLLARAEISYALGSMGEAKIGGFFVGAQLGFRIAFSE